MLDDDIPSSSFERDLALIKISLEVMRWNADDSGLLLDGSFCVFLFSVIFFRRG